jgi:hypothetical protein
VRQKDGLERRTRVLQHGRGENRRPRHARGAHHQSEEQEGGRESAHDEEKRGARVCAGRTVLGALCRASTVTDTKMARAAAMPVRKLPQGVGRGEGPTPMNIASSSSYKDHLRGRGLSRLHCTLVGLVAHGRGALGVDNKQGGQQHKRVGSRG